MYDGEKANQDAIRTLIRSITRLQGDFSLILACCNYRSVRETIVQQLRVDCPVPIQELVLDPKAKTLYTTIFDTLQGEMPSALMVFGLESVNNLQGVLKATNQMREEFRNFEFPLILWVSDQLVSMMIRLVPDFHSFATTIHFEVETDHLIDFLKQTSNQILEQLLDSGATIFLDEATLELESGSPLRNELESAQQDLQRRGVTLDQDLEASLELILGRIADHTTQEALQHYQRSLTLWQQTNNRLGCGHVLFYLGFWWRYYGMMNRGEKWEACAKAKDYYRQSLQEFESADRPDLVAKFINALGEILHYLENWSELDEVANWALDLHQNQSHSFRTARAYHFLAEVQLANGNFKTAKYIIQKSLEIINSNLSQNSQVKEGKEIRNYEYLRKLDWERSYHWGWYLLCFGRSQQGLGEHEEAIATFKQAKNLTKPCYDPELYIKIFKQLHYSYFRQGEYLAAYQVKQQQREIEQQFSFRPFIGAGALQQSQLITNPSYPQSEDRTLINSEMTASGRLQDIDQLMKRLGEDRYKLTIIYGQSGVGKSSLLQAGLIPQLRHKNTLIQARRVLPIYQKTYTNWVGGLSNAIARALSQLDNSELDSGFLTNPTEILDQLQVLNYRNLVMIIIFDKFEEFFVATKEPQKREEFYQFLRECLNIPYIKTIFALRQDYLHHLLEGNRLKYFDAVNDNILDKNILYYLGNFIPEDAASVIKNLTAKTQFILEPELIKQLVQELAGESGEVRPIELQIVGSQLYTNQITTLEEYRLQGPKRRLVESYLEEVVADCGEENKDIAELVLYLLTDEYNNRPLKTRYALNRDLQSLADNLKITDQLDTVLKIFVLSGLVCLLPEIPEERYQLVHDYLVSFIREQRSSELVYKLQNEKQKRQEAEAEITEINQVLRKRLVNTIGLCIGLSLLSIAVLMLWHNTKTQEKQLKLARFNYEYLALLKGETDQLKASLTAMEAGRILQRQPVTEIERRTASSLWEVNNIFRERDRLSESFGGILSLSFNPTGDQIVSGDQDGTIRIWNQNRELIGSWLANKRKIRRVVFSPNSSGQELIIASAGEDENIKLWRPDGTLINTLIGHTRDIQWLSFSPDGQQLASASEDGTIRLWSRDGDTIAILTGHEAEVLSVSFSPDEQLIVSSDEMGVIKLWNRQGELITSFQGHDQAIWSVKFSPDSQILASASNDNTVKLWNLDGTLSQTLTGHEKSVNSVNFSPNGRLIVTASTDTTIKLWNYEGILVSTLRGHRNTVNHAVFAPDSQTLISASADGSIRFWGLQNLPRVWQSPRDIYNAVFSPNSELIASVSSNNMAIVWETNSLNIRLMFDEHTDTVNNISFSPDSQLIASASNDKTVKIWNTEGDVLRTINHDFPVWTVSFSPDGQKIASVSDDQIIRLWDINGVLQTTLIGHTDRINDISFNQQAQIMASVGDNTIKIWDINGSLIRDLSQGSHFSKVAFSPNGTLLAVGTGDGSVKLWETSDWKPITTTTIGRHNRVVFDLSFNSTGEILASASQDGTVKLWDRSGQLITTLEVGIKPVLSVHFSADDQMLVATDADNRMVFWELDYSNFNQVDYLLDQACDRLQNYLNRHNNNPAINPNICN
ncbi:MAG: sugar-binding protein [Limnospira sp. PMC 1291.21]|uniref:YD repeat protein n=2 Tax=Limnospira TaxID=2596745 RepID=A0A9P1NWM8_9CYAN|nr:MULTISPECIES: sugar-binding protein [Limnospira]MDT9178511.1 sugar-binding protein [Limnospira sp. PMC 1238.20]MDT9188557.1 sugar-binding protein [Limnospira sp. PMC 894.15]MDT9193700.1 sugar-binding protein [Limnospira sp. PMC 1245.20]MDT9198857.1 sugar-binding protein [Limnospira sp. PMC 1042.18]MDT9203932.1 sugar-binding protein [Limnospira sp. PMC 1243.20]